MIQAIKKHTKMEEGRDNVSMPFGDLLALSQELSGRDVKYARLEMTHEILETKYRDLDTRYRNLESKCRDLEARLDTAEEARQKAVEESMHLRMVTEAQRHEIDVLNAKVQSLVGELQRPDRDAMQRAVEYLMQRNLLLSILQLKNFMSQKVSDLNTAMMLQSFVLACVPDPLQPAALAVIKSVMMLPDKPVPGGQTNINSQVFNGKIEDSTINGAKKNDE